MLARLTKLPASTIIERLHKFLNINENRYDIVQKEEFTNKIHTFKDFINKVLPQLKEFKVKLRSLREIK
jgi:hypothetical protein